MDGQTGERRDRFARIVIAVGTRRTVLRALVGGALGGAGAIGAASPDVAAVYEDDWRLCQKCRGLFHLFQGGGRLCPAGGAHRPTSKYYRLDEGGTPGPNHETGWRWCSTCGLLTYQGGGPCPGGSGTHSLLEPVYHLEYNVPPGQGEESGWRYCSKCEVLFNGRRRKRGVCAAGGAHKPYPGYVYNLELSTPLG